MEVAVPVRAPAGRLKQQSLRLQSQLVRSFAMESDEDVSPESLPRTGVSGMARVSTAVPPMADNTVYCLTPVAVSETTDAVPETPEEQLLHQPGLAVPIAPPALQPISVGVAPALSQPQPGRPPSRPGALDNNLPWPNSNHALGGTPYHTNGVTAAGCVAPHGGFQVSATPPLQPPLPVLQPSWPPAQAAASPIKLPNSSSWPITSPARQPCQPIPSDNWTPVVAARQASPSWNRPHQPAAGRAASPSPSKPASTCYPLPLAGSPVHHAVPPPGPPPYQPAAPGDGGGQAALSMHLMTRQSSMSLAEKLQRWQQPAAVGAAAWQQPQVQQQQHSSWGQQHKPPTLPAHGSLPAGPPPHQQLAPPQQVPWEAPATRVAPHLAPSPLKGLRHAPQARQQSSTSAPPPALVYQTAVPLEQPVPSPGLVESATPVLRQPPGDNSGRSCVSTPYDDDTMAAIESLERRLERGCGLACPEPAQPHPDGCPTLPAQAPADQDRQGLGPRQLGQGCQVWKPAAAPGQPLQAPFLPGQQLNRTSQQAGPAPQQPLSAAPQQPHTWQVATAQGRASAPQGPGIRTWAYNAAAGPRQPDLTAASTAASTEVVGTGGATTLAVQAAGRTADSEPALPAQPHHLLAGQQQQQQQQQRASPPHVPPQPPQPLWQQQHPQHKQLKPVEKEQTEVVPALLRSGQPGQPVASTTSTPMSETFMLAIDATLQGIDARGQHQQQHHQQHQQHQQQHHQQHQQHQHQQHQQQHHHQQQQQQQQQQPVLVPPVVEPQRWQQQTWWGQGALGAQAQPGQAPVAAQPVASHPGCPLPEPSGRQAGGQAGCAQQTAAEAEYKEEGNMPHQQQLQQLQQQSVTDAAGTSTHPVVNSPLPIKQLAFTPMASKLGILGHNRELWSRLPGAQQPYTPFHPPPTCKEEAAPAQQEAGPAAPCPPPQQLVPADDSDMGCTLQPQPPQHDPDAVTPKVEEELQGRQVDEAGVDSSDCSSDAGDEARGERAAFPAGLSQHATQARVRFLAAAAPSLEASNPGSPTAAAGHAVEAEEAEVESEVEVEVEAVVEADKAVVTVPCLPAGQAKRKLADYLPQEIVQVYQDEFGMKRDLYEWQAECLMTPGVLYGSNLVFCAPTSAGKTIVYEILALRRLLTTGKPFMLVLPTVVLCAQKAAALEKLLKPMKRQVKSFYGGLGSGTYFEHDTGAIVCTIEKANMMVNRMLEEDSLGQLGALVVDELHMVGDDDRGYLLELLLTKLRYATFTMTVDREEDMGCGGGGREEGVQVVGMSATMPNVDQVARWLGAQLFISHFRPVPLQQFVKVKDAALNTVRKLEPPTPAWAARDTDQIALLALETVSEGHSCLIFCASKAACEQAAKQIAGLLGEIPEKGQRKEGEAAAGGKAGAAAEGAVGLGAMKGLGGPPGTPATPAQPGFTSASGQLALLTNTGLMPEECHLVEAAYSSGAVSVLCCTSTMAVGVNLPARRVIFRHAFVGLQTNPIDVATYRQMSGRAGRAGIDDAGESILVACGAFSAAKLASLITSDSAPINSCLVEGKRGMKRAMLEVVVSGAVSSAGDVSRYIQCTLLAATHDFQAEVASATKAALKWLVKEEFVTQQRQGPAGARLAAGWALGSIRANINVHAGLRWDTITSTYVPSPLGKATLASGMDPADALLVKQDLAKAREAFVMATDLHLTYLVAPARLDDISIDWAKLYNVTQALQGPDATVMEKAGVRQQLLMNMKLLQRSRTTKLTDTQLEGERVAKKFCASLALYDLINEVPMQAVLDKFGMKRTTLINLQDRASKTAAMVAAFCGQLGWCDLEMLVAKFQGRINSGVREEIVALTEIPGVRGYRARLLYKAGLRTPEAVAACELSRLTDILAAGMAASSKGKTEDQGRAGERRAARMILNGARELLSMKAKDLRAQASAVLAAMQQQPAVQPQALEQRKQQEQHAWSGLAGHAQSNAVKPAATAPPRNAAAGQQRAAGPAASHQPRPADGLAQARTGTLSEAPSRLQSSGGVPSSAWHPAPPAITLAQRPSPMKQGQPGSITSLPSSTVAPTPHAQHPAPAPALMKAGGTVLAAPAVTAALALAPACHALSCTADAPPGRGLAPPPPTPCPHPSGILPLRTAKQVSDLMTRLKAGRCTQLAFCFLFASSHASAPTPFITTLQLPDPLAAARQACGAAPTAANGSSRWALHSPTKPAAAAGLHCCSDADGNGNEGGRQGGPTGTSGLGVSLNGNVVARVPLGCQGDLEGVALSVEDGSAYWVPLKLAVGRAGEAAVGSEEGQCLQAVMQLLQDPSITKVTYNLKQQLAGLHALTHPPQLCPPTNLWPPPPQTCLPPPSARHGGGERPADAEGAGQGGGEGRRLEWRAGWGQVGERGGWLGGRSLIPTEPLVDVVVACWLMQPDSPLNKEWAMQGKSGVKAAWKALDGLLRSLPQVSPNAVQEALAGIPMPGMWLAGPAADSRGLPSSNAAGPGSGSSSGRPSAPRGPTGPGRAADSAGMAGRGAFGPGGTGRLSSGSSSARSSSFDLVLPPLPTLVTGYAPAAATAGSTSGSGQPVNAVTCLPMAVSGNHAGNAADRNDGGQNRGAGLEEGSSAKAGGAEESQERGGSEGVGPGLSNLPARLPSCQHARCSQRSWEELWWLWWLQVVASEVGGAKDLAFSLSSPKDVSDLLFNRLKLPVPPNASKGKNRQISTGADVLQELVEEHVVVPVIMEHRKLNKLLSSLNGQLAEMCSVPSGLMRLAGEFQQTGTSTGRLAMGEPNLQVELRMMAHLSQDAVLCGMLQQPGADPFKGLAASWLQIPQDQVTSTQRAHAKQLAYGMLYGMGPAALAASLGVTPGEALALSTKFMQALPGVEAWIKRLVAECRRCEYVVTLAGRRRYLPNINACNGSKLTQNKLRSHAERQAVNTTTQGSAADLIKRAMVQLHKQLALPHLLGAARLVLQASGPGPPKAGLLRAQVHDELLYEVSEARLADVARVVAEAMSKSWLLSVATPVKLSIGPSWGELTEVTLEQLTRPRSR
ncbi:hypothetical protein V8C86DRAFT_3034055 [Haematococcus lacustris]